MGVIDLTDELILKGLEIMLKSRLFEREIALLFSKGELHGTTHLNIGQEATEAGLSLALQPGDWFVPTHRCHGYTVSTGSDLSRMFSEMFGSRNGLSKGLGGSMHMSDRAHGNPGSSAVVGSGVPIATGLGFALKHFGKDNISVAIFGDGASSRGAVHESMNQASVEHLPVLFFCENNGYGMSVKADRVVSVARIADRGAAYSIPSVRVDGNDLVAVYEAVVTARRLILKTHKPYLIECMTYRLNGHSKSDDCRYRSREEEEVWSSRCPIKRCRRLLEKQGVLDGKRYEQLYARVHEEVLQALEKAKATREEVLGLDEAFSYTYAPPVSYMPAFASMHRATGREALREALREEALRDRNVVLLGEDIGLYGGCFKVTGDLYLNIPKDQLIETPVSEEGFAGVAVGASLLGLRPVVEIMYGDFLTLVSDALVNHASKIRFMSAGQFNCPLVVRLPMGSGTGHGAQHSQSLEAMVLNVPGLKVVAPSCPRYAKALLKAAIRDDDPVVFIEQKKFYGMEGNVGTEDDLMSLGKAMVTPGDDVTVISYGYQAHLCRIAAEKLAEEGISCEVVDLCTLKPLDKEAIITSAIKTGRVVIVQEAPLCYGADSEIAATICENQEAFSALQVPIVRLGGLELPVPFSKELERASCPGLEQILTAIRKTCGK